MVAEAGIWIVLSIVVLGCLIVGLLEAPRRW